jgi:hypothetical protein
MTELMFEFFMNSWQVVCVNLRKICVFVGRLNGRMDV